MTVSPSAQIEGVEKDLKNIKETGDRVEVSDILAMREKHDLSIATTLDLVDRALLRKQVLGKSSPEMLQSFIANIVSGFEAKTVFECGAYGSSLVARLFDQKLKFDLTYSGYQNQFSDLFEGLLPEGSSVVDFLSPIEGEFDLVVCHPPLGLKHKIHEFTEHGVVEKASKSVSEMGHMIWLTSRNVLFNKAKIEFVKSLGKQGIYLLATIEVPSGAFSNLSSIAGILLVFGRRKFDTKLIGTIRDSHSHPRLIQALLSPQKTIGGSLWRWIGSESDTTFGAIEAEQNIKKMLPKGTFELMNMANFIDVENIVKADKLSKTNEPYVYLPEYITSYAASSLDELTGKPKAMYRISVDVSKISPKFLVWVLNSDYGKLERERVGTGSTIRRISRTSIPSLRVPVPSLPVQNRIAKLQSDIDLLKANLENLQIELKGNWQGLENAEAEVSNMLSVTDIEHQIEHWWQELPYPLATIYRRYRNSSSSKDSYEALLHFFEVLAVYTAMLGTSYVKVIREDSETLLSKWLSPNYGATLQRTDFNFWNSVTAGSLKALKFTLADTSPKGQSALDAVRVKVGPFLLADAASVAELQEIHKPLEDARAFRNSKSHGGLIKEKDAVRNLSELETVLRQAFS